jgi:hypothetical protein
LRAGQDLIEPAQDVDTVIFPTSGLVSTRVIFETGHQVECVLGGRNSAIHAFAARGFASSLAREVCLVGGHGWSMPIADLQAAVQRWPEVRAAVTRCCEEKMAYAIRIGACNSLHVAEQRLARWLLTAVDLLEQDELSLSQEEVANVLGLQRTAINPLLQRFQSGGLVALGRGKLTVVDPEGIRRKSCECHDTIQRAVARSRSLAEPPLV